jgi:hypothetical protein
LKKGSPDYLIYPTGHLNRMTQALKTDKICVIDWGEAFDMFKPPKHDMGIPLSFASPELALDRKCGPASDFGLWLVQWSRYV